MLLGRWKGAWVAVKMVREELMDLEYVATDLRREADLMQCFRHPFILEFYGAIIDKKTVRRHHHQMTDRKVPDQLTCMLPHFCVASQSS